MSLAKNSEVASQGIFHNRIYSIDKVYAIYYLSQKWKNAIYLLTFFL
jgi:hypothetical protein